MNVYEITYVDASLAKRDGLPAVVEADSYRTAGAFIDFVLQSPLDVQVTVRIRGNAVMMIKLRPDAARS